MLRLLHSAIDPKDSLSAGHVAIRLQATRITLFLNEMQLIRQNLEYREWSASSLDASVRVDTRK